MSALATTPRRQAEERLSRDYRELKTGVMTSLRSALHRYGLHDFSDEDLDGFYNTAWFALYREMAAGREIKNAPGFLVTAATRRAIDEARAMRRLRRDVPLALSDTGVEPDYAEQLGSSRAASRVSAGPEEEADRTRVPSGLPLLAARLHPA